MQDIAAPVHHAPHLRVTNGRLLINGVDTLLCGDSVTQGWMELGAEWNAEAYLRALREAGANAVMLWSYIGITDQRADHRIGVPTSPVWPWKHQDGYFQTREADPRYDRALRRFLELAAAHGLAVVITVHDGWTKTRFAGHPCNRAVGGYLTCKDEYVQLHQPGKPMRKAPNPDAPPAAHHQYMLEQFTDRLCRAANGMQHVIFEVLNEGEWYPPDACIRFTEHFGRFIRERGAWPVMINHPAFRSSRLTSLLSVHTPLCDASITALRAWTEHTREARAAQHPLVLSETVPEYAGGEAELLYLARLAWGAALAGSHLLLQNDCSFGWHPGVTMASRREDALRVYRLEGSIRRLLDTRGCIAIAAPELCADPVPICALPDQSRIWLYQQAGTQPPEWRIHGRYTCFLYDAVTGKTRWRGLLTLPDERLPEPPTDTVAVLSIQAAG